MEAADRVGIARPMPTPMKATRHMMSHSVVLPPSCASRMRPMTKHPAPAAAGRRGPMRSLRRPALGAMMRAMTGITVNAIAARSSVYPSTETRKMTTIRNVAAHRHADEMIAVLAAVNERIRSSFTGTSATGCATPTT